VPNASSIVFKMYAIYGSFSFSLLIRSDWWVVGSSYLAGRDELQRPESAAHVWDVGLELLECSCDLSLDLGRVLPRWAVGSDLVERGCHGCGVGRQLCEVVNVAKKAVL